MLVVKEVFTTGLSAIWPLLLTKRASCGIEYLRVIKLRNAQDWGESNGI